MLIREIVGKYGLFIGPILLSGSLTEENQPVSPGLIALSIVIGVAHLLAAAILVLRTPNRQATWDRIARTTVVKAG